MSDSLMSEEIFGPLLPVMKMDYKQACSITQFHEHPRGLYIFNTSAQEIEYILSQLSPAV